MNREIEKQQKCEFVEGGPAERPDGLRLPEAFDVLCLRVPGTHRRATLDDSMACILPRGHDRDGMDEAEDELEPDCIFGNAAMVAQAAGTINA